MMFEYTFLSCGPTRIRSVVPNARLFMLPLASSYVV